MSFRTALRAAALVVAAVLVASTATTAAADVRHAPEGPSVVGRKIAQVADGHSHSHGHSHGAQEAAPDHLDPAPDGVDVHRRVPTAELLPRSHSRSNRGPELVGLRAAAARGGDEPALTEAASTIAPGTPALPGLTSHVARSCAGNGSDGNRVQALYVVEADDPERFSDVLPLLKDEIANVDDTFALSAAETGGSRRIRWTFDDAQTCEPTITKVVVPAGSLVDFRGSVAALRAAGYTNPRRKYLAFADTAILCGVGHVFRDDRRVGNANDGTTTAMFARVDTGCWQTMSSHGSTAAHELMHTIGGVQQSAPHVTPYGHCTDRYELMCYADGSGATMTNACPTSHQSLFDCNHDDYFSTSPASGSYLATYWNTAGSSFLDAAAAALPVPVPLSPPVPPATTTTTTTSTTAMPPATVEPVTPVAAPTVTVAGPSSLLPGLPAQLVATGSGAGTYFWSASVPECVDGTSDAAVLNVQCTADRARPLVATVTFVRGDGQAASARHVVSVSTAPALLTQRLSAARAAVPPGGATKVIARLLRGRVPVRGRVSVAASTNGRSWQVITAGADTGADGVLTFVTRPKRTTYLRLTTSVASGSGWSVTRAPVLRVKVTRAAATLSITVEKGRPARISGRLITTIAPQGVAHRSVSLQYKQAGRKEWQTLRSLITDRTGRVSTPVKSIRGRYYRWRFAGTTSELPDLSSAAHLR